jgi:hypothetical protein
MICNTLNNILIIVTSLEFNRLKKKQYHCLIFNEMPNKKRKKVSTNVLCLEQKQLE